MKRETAHGSRAPQRSSRLKPSATATENEKVADPVHGDNTDDAARWWRAYQLAENDQVDELRRLAAAGDDHARRQLASWLSDRAFAGGPGDLAKLGEAIEVIRPLADAGDDVAELWLARWLADCDRLDELRERAGAGGYHASQELARLLADHDLLDELRDRVSAESGHDALRQLARRLIERDMSEELRELIEAADADTRPLILDAAGGASSNWMNAMRVLADFGHKASLSHLARTLAREGRLDELRQRAGNGDEYAQHWLDEALGRLTCGRSVEGKEQAVACLPATGDRSGQQGAERGEFEALDAIEGIPGLRASPVAGDPDIASSVEHGP